MEQGKRDAELCKLRWQMQLLLEEHADRLTADDLAELSDAVVRVKANHIIPLLDEDEDGDLDLTTWSLVRMTWEAAA